MKDGSREVWISNSYYMRERGSGEIIKHSLYKDYEQEK